MKARCVRLSLTISPENSLLSFLSPFLLPLISLGFLSLLTLDLCHQPLVFLFVRGISLLLLSQALRCQNLRILSQFSDRALLFSLVLLLQFCRFCSSLVWIIVFIRVERFLEFGDRSLDCKWTVVMQFQRTASQACLIEK